MDPMDVVVINAQPPPFHNEGWLKEWFEIRRARKKRRAGHMHPGDPDYEISQHDLTVMELHGRAHLDRDHPTDDVVYLGVKCFGLYQMQYVRPVDPLIWQYLHWLQELARTCPAVVEQLRIAEPRLSTQKLRAGDTPSRDTLFAFMSPNLNIQRFWHVSISCVFGGRCVRSTASYWDLDRALDDCAQRLYAKIHYTWYLQDPWADLPRDPNADMDDPFCPQRSCLSFGPTFNRSGAVYYANSALAPPSGAAMRSAGGSAHSQAVRTADRAFAPSASASSISDAHGLWTRGPNDSLVSASNPAEARHRDLVPWPVCCPEPLLFGQGPIPSVDGQLEWCLPDDAYKLGNLNVAEITFLPWNKPAELAFTLTELSLEPENQVVLEKVVNAICEALMSVRAVPESDEKAPAECLLRVDRIVRGGSFAKGTNLRYVSDIDLIVHVHDFDEEQMLQYFVTAQQLLRNHGTIKPLIVSCRPLNERALHLELEVPELLFRRYYRRVEVDILFTVSTTQFSQINFSNLSPDQAKPLFCCYSQQQVDFVCNYAQRDSRIRDCIILGKLWRVQSLLRRVPRLKSYVIEILVIHTYVKYFERQPSDSWSFRHLFHKFLAEAVRIDRLQVRHVHKLLHHVSRSMSGVFVVTSICLCLV